MKYLLSSLTRALTDYIWNLNVLQVKYEDNDQEDLDWSELELVLIAETLCKNPCKS